MPRRFSSFLARPQFQVANAFAGSPENKETGGSPFAPCEIRRSTNRKNQELPASLDRFRCRENWLSISLHSHDRARKLESLAASGVPGPRQ
jgi:hypothetical protein